MSAGWRPCGRNWTRPRLRPPGPGAGRARCGTRLPRRWRRLPPADLGPRVLIRPHPVRDGGTAISTSVLAQGSRLQRGEDIDALRPQHSGELCGNILVEIEPAVERG